MTEPVNYEHEAHRLLAERQKIQQVVLAAIRSMPLGYRPQDVADELQLIGFAALADVRPQPEPKPQPEPIDVGEVVWTDGWR